MPSLRKILDDSHRESRVMLDVRVRENFVVVESSPVVNEFDFLRVNIFEFLADPLLQDTDSLTRVTGQYLGNTILLNYLDINIIGQVGHPSKKRLPLRVGPYKFIVLQKRKSIRCVQIK